MKKLMCAVAAAAVCGIASAVESSNVVGYQNVVIAEGYSMMSPTFQKVDGSEFDLQDLVLGGEGLGTCKGDVEIQIISSTGNWVGDYFYYNSANKSFPDVGWYDADDEFVTPGTITLSDGEAVFVTNNQGEDVAFVFSGVVAKGSANALPEGYMQTGNTSPVSIDLQDFVPAGEGLGTCKGDIELQTISTAGAWDGDYFYYNSANKSYPDVGWYDSDDEFVELGTISLTPGAGCFLTNNQGEDIYMSVPNPLANP